MRSLFAWLVAVIGIGCLSPTYGQLGCKIANWHNIHQDADHGGHISRQLNSSSSDIVQASRYGTGPDGQKLLWAHQDYSLAFAEAGSIPTQNVRSLGAKSFVEAMGRADVLESRDSLANNNWIDFAKTGRGFGRLTGDVSDAEVEDFFLNAKFVFTHPDSLTSGMFRVAGYFEGHLMRDIDDLTANGAPLGIKKLLEQTAGDRNGGLQYQLAVSAKIKRKRAEAVESVESDVVEITGSAIDLSGTGVDIRTDISLYSVTKSITGVVRKVDAHAQIKKAMEKALLYQRKFKIIYGSGPDIPLSEPGLQNAIINYNNSLMPSEFHLRLDSTNFVKEVLE